MGIKDDTHLTPKIGGGRSADRKRHCVGGQRTDCPRGERILDGRIRGARHVGQKEVGVWTGRVSSRKLLSCTGW